MARNPSRYSGALADRPDPSDEQPEKQAEEITNEPGTTKDSTAQGSVTRGTPAWMSSWSAFGQVLRTSPIAKRENWQRGATRTRTWAAVDARTWGRRMISPLGTMVLAAVVLLALVGYTLGGGFDTSAAPDNSMGDMPGMGGSSSSSTQTSVPHATQDFGNQPAKYTMDSDGAKHFNFTAKQVMWDVVKGHPVLAWTLDGTVPGPQIRVTAGDHVRVTIKNTFPEATTIHFHGLEIPANEDGVPGVGQKPIQPGESFTYDFTVSDDNVGTYFYHSHYDDLKQVSGGLYGAFIVDPRPGTSQAQQAVHADQEYVQMISELGGYFVINGKSFPDTQVMHVKQGQTILVRVINIGEMIHPMHLHGHFFNIVAEDGAPLAQPVRRDTLQIAPGESTDFTFYAWAAPGSVYPFHCHILTHVMNPGQTGDEMGGLITLVQYDK
jgi:FtsP/CotA-like multicopper oxidase with cupredoxin domain